MVSDSNDDGDTEIDGDADRATETRGVTGAE